MAACFPAALARAPGPRTSGHDIYPTMDESPAPSVPRSFRRKDQKTSAVAILGHLEEALTRLDQCACGVR